MMIITSESTSAVGCPSFFSCLLIPLDDEVSGVWHSASWVLLTMEQPQKVLDRDFQTDFSVIYAM